MNRKQVDAIWMCASIFCFLMLSLSFLLMPLGNENPIDDLSTYSFVAGIIFWISVIMGIVTQCVLARRRKLWYASHKIKKAKLNQKIGLVSFFRNAYATVVDFFAIISLVGLVIAIVATKATGYICYIFVSLFVFSFCMHCILNGKNYYYVTNKNKLLASIEKERVNSSK